MSTRDRNCKHKLLLLLLLMIFIPGCTGKSDSSEAPLNLLIITADTLRSDRLGCYGFQGPSDAPPITPGLDQLARDGVLFTNAFAPRGSTWPSLTTIHTGLYPLSHGVRNNGQMLSSDVTTLAQRLHQKGFRTAAFLNNMIHAPHPGFAQIWSIDDELGTERKYSVPYSEWDRRLTKNALSWLSKDQGEKPFFLWLHYMEPHEPYAPSLEMERLYAPARGAKNGTMRDLGPITLDQEDLSSVDLARIQGLYNAQVASLDRSILSVLRKLEDEGLSQNTLIVFASDHGEELYDHHHYFFHACSSYDSVLRVPLVISLPSRLPKGKRVATQVELVDLVPTVLDLIGPGGSFPGDNLEGESLLPVILEDKSRKNPYVFAEWVQRGHDTPGTGPEIYVIRSEVAKFIHNPTGFQPDNNPYGLREGVGFPQEVEEYYDLTVDPRELNNLAASRQAEVEELRKILNEWVQSKLKTTRTPGSPDEKTLNNLKALGYVR